jgi:hypothetical protein
LSFAPPTPSPGAADHPCRRDLPGAYTPEAIGDYVGGPNHVLPTARSARFSSGLSVLDFMKRTTLAKMTPEALKAIGPAAERLAISESLQAHGLSVRARLDRLNGSARLHRPHPQPGRGAELARALAGADLALGPRSS